MKPSANCAAIIKHCEGLKLTAYKCPAGKWTIGYGHTGKDVKPGMVITEARAIELLQQDMATAAGQVDDLVTVNLTQGQLDALVSFVFNLGAGRLRDSTLLRFVNQGEFGKAYMEFSKWVYSNAVKLNGLVKRRTSEATLFYSGNLRLPA